MVRSLRYLSVMSLSSSEKDRFGLNWKSFGSSSVLVLGATSFVRMEERDTGPLLSLSGVDLSDNSRDLRDVRSFEYLVKVDEVP